MTFVLPSYFSTDGYFAPLPATSSAGPLVTISNPSTAVTVNVSTAVTITNPSTQVNTLSSGPILVLSSGPITGTVNTLSSGAILIAGIPTVIAASSAGHQIGSLTSGIVNTLSSGAILLSSAGFVQTYPVWGQSSSRLIITTSVGKISSAPGVLTMLRAYTTGSSAGTTAYVRIYDQTTGNATSANNSGLAGACFMARIGSSITGVSVDDVSDFSYGLKFGTACSFDLVLTATSTAANALGGWVSAQYTS